MSHCSGKWCRRPCRTQNERWQTQLAAGPDPDLNGIDFLNIQRKIRRSTWAHPTALFHCSAPPLLCGIISPKEKSCMIQSSALHGTNAEGVFPDWRHFPFALGRLSKMCEFATHCRSLPSERPAAACSHPKAVQQPLPPVRSSLPLCTVKFQRSVWLLNAFGLKDILHPNLSVYCLYLYSSSGLSLLEDGIFAEWRTGWCSADFQNEFRRGHTALPLLSKQLCPIKSNCCNNYFFVF